jgi:hypothetical protein
MLEDAFDQLAAARHTEDFWQWPRRCIAEESRRSARRKNQHAMSRLAAKHFLPGESDDIELRPIESLGKGGGSCIADRQPPAVGGDPIAIGDTHARRRSIPGENDIIVEIDGLEIDDLAIARFQDADVFQL